MKVTLSRRFILPLLVLTILFIANAIRVFPIRPGFINSVASIDEIFSVYLSNGIVVGGRTDSEEKYYQQIKSEEIRNNNTLSQIYKNTLRDGGNAFLYYAISHLLSVSIGKYLGIMNAMRLFNIIVAWLLLYSIYRFCYRTWSPLTAIVSSIIFISVGYEYAFFLRTYGLCALVTFHFVLFIAKIYNKENVSLHEKLVAGIMVLAMAWLHFFCLFVIGICGLFLLITRGKSVIYLFKNLYPVLAALFIFFSWYILCNQEGRKYQLEISQWRTELAGKYGTPEGKTWIVPTKPHFLVAENLEWLSYYTGTDMRNLSDHIHLKHLILLLAGLVFLIYKGLLTDQSKTISLFICCVVLYLIFLNLLAIQSGHVTSVEYKFYGYIVFPFLCIACGYVIARNLQDSRMLYKLAAIAYALLFVVSFIINDLNQYTHPDIGFTNKTTDPEVILYQKIENQFR